MKKHLIPKIKQIAKKLYNFKSEDVEILLPNSRVGNG